MFVVSQIVRLDPAFWIAVTVDHGGPTAIRIEVIPGQTTLASRAAQQRQVRPRRFTTSADGLRFAFYGRMSTIDLQDRASSCRWQRDYAQDLVAGHGALPRAHAADDQPHTFDAIERPRGHPPACSAAVSQWDWNPQAATCAFALGRDEPTPRFRRSGLDRLCPRRHQGDPHADRDRRADALLRARRASTRAAIDGLRHRAGRRTPIDCDRSLSANAADRG